MTHPLLRSMYEMFIASPRGLKSLFTIVTLEHVATYVVVLENDTLLCNVLPKTKKKQEERATFGGCNHANNLPRMINSLRLELMDEAALVILEGDEDAYFHDLCVVGDCLVQVVVLKELPATGLFCPEKARQNDEFCKMMDNLHEARTAQPTLVAAAAKEFAVTECPLVDVKPEERKFRECDWITWTALESGGHIANAMQAAQTYFDTGVHQQGQAQLFCHEPGPFVRCRDELMRLPGFVALLEAAKSPWSPLLWSEAKCLEDYKLFECLLRDPEGSTVDSVAKVGQAAQVLLWRALCVRAEKDLCPLWLTEGTKHVNDVKAQVDDWLDARELLGLLRFEGVGNRILKYNFTQAGTGLCLLYTSDAADE